MTKAGKYLISVVFLISIFLMLCFFLMESRPLDAKKYFDSEDIHWKDQYIELYGEAQKILDKKTIEDFSIVKNSYGKLTKPYAEVNDEQIATKMEQLIPIFEYCDEKGISYLYLTSLLPIADETDLPYSSLDHSHLNAERLADQLESKDINIFDLRQLDVGDKEQRFYRTDHHWTTDTTFFVFKALADKLQVEYPNNYNEYIIPQSFLGSYGIKVGKYYAGKDDFKVLVPTEEGQYTFESYDANGNLLMSKMGSWFDTLIDQEILLDVDYNNKYNSWLRGQSIEMRIVNEEVDNDEKLLLVSHSYGRPLAAYLSTCFHVVRQLDPQRGRFIGNYLDYIDEYQPDIVLFLVEFEGDIIGEYNVERIAQTPSGGVLSSR